MNSHHEGFNSATMQRLNLYLHYLHNLPAEVTAVKPRQIADALLLDPQLVRQDMKILLGKDRVSEESRKDLFLAIAKRTEIRKVKSVIIVGVGKLGSALISYAGFTVYDLDILAGFDVKEKLIKKGAHGKPVYHIDKLPEVCRRLNARIGVICTPGSIAQKICNILVDNGITAIWNFTATRLKAPSHVMIHNEDMSISLRSLAEHAAMQEIK